MQAPGFWYKPRSFYAAALWPLGVLYGAATARRIKRGTPRKFAIPVICVGNINAGGTGKTPTVIALAQYLQNRGVAAHIVSRGYGGSLRAVTRVDEKTHSADQTGDEPLLMSAFAPTWVAPSRAQGIEAAQNSGAEIVILDDGHQDPSIAKDLSIIVADAKRGFGNGLCLPAGPLREPVSAGLARADVVVSIGTPAAQNSFVTVDLQAVPMLRARLEPLQMGMDWGDGRYIAFAGIGYPQKFFDTLNSLGADVVATHALDDHQPLSRALMRRLLADAQAHGAQLVTTEKDAARLPREYLGSVLALPVRLEFDDPAALDRLLAPLMKTL